MQSALAVLSMGLVLGLQHATDADHVAAVSTIVAGERRLGAAARVGVAWGLGHSATVMVAGGAMVLSGVVLPTRLALGFELVVAMMLVVLGVAGIRRALAARELPAEPPPGPRPIARPAVVGVVHGLAGSAALALAVLATVGDRVLAVGYLALFCVGTVAGMTLVTGLLATPVVASRRLGRALARPLALVAGALSIACGLWLGYRVGFEDGLFLGVAHAALP